MADVFQEFIATLKQKLNIVEVAGGYIGLERRGANYWACCPFHHEKTPSFCINEADQFYHCFGCGESGDVIKFVREMENIDFMDAVKLLADRAKIPVPQSNYDNSRTVEQKRKRDVILKILNDTAHFYLDNLNSGNADKHIEYILSRQIPSNIVRTFGLGASLNFTDLPKFLLSKGYDVKDMLDSGVVNSVDDRLVDSQGGRLIFPIINAMDEVIAFGGRALKKVPFGKYVNTKETLVFNKSKSLYNINLLKKLKKSQNIKEVIIVEGYMDTLSLYRAGFKNVVASMGTSLTQEQARLVKRYTDTVLISYDGDPAGQKGNLRGLDILKGEGLNVKVVPLVDDLDPDDIIKQLGAEAYSGCLNKAMPLNDYKLLTLKKSYNLKKPDEKRRYVQEAIKIIKGVESAVEQEDLLKSVRDATGVTFESLKRDLSNAPKENVASAPPAPAPEKEKIDVAQKASRYVVAAYLFGAPFAADCSLKDIPFPNEVHAIIAKYVLSKQLMEEKVQPSELFEFFEEGTAEYAELCKILDYSAGDRFNSPVSEKYFYDCVKKLRLEELDGRISEIRSQIDGETDLIKRRQMITLLQQLTDTKRKITNGDKK